MLLEGFTAAETIIAMGLIGLFFLVLVGLITAGAIIVWHRISMWLHAQDDLWLDRAYLSRNK